MRLLMIIATVLAVAFIFTKAGVNQPEASEPNELPDIKPPVSFIQPVRAAKPISPVSYSYFAVKKKVAVKKPAKQPKYGTVEAIKAAITKYAKIHGISPSWLLRVAWCESRYNPRAVNYNYYAGGGHPSGLFQYLPETWRRIGSRSPYGIGNIWNYEHQAKVTAWAFANGYAREWACK